MNFRRIIMTKLRDPEIQEMNRRRRNAVILLGLMFLVTLVIYQRFISVAFGCFFIGTFAYWYQYKRNYIMEGYDVRVGRVVDRFYCDRFGWTEVMVLHCNDGPGGRVERIEIPVMDRKHVPPIGSSVKFFVEKDAEKSLSPAPGSDYMVIPMCYEYK